MAPRSMPDSLHSSLFNIGSFPLTSAGISTTFVSFKKAGYGPGFGSIKEAQDYEKQLAKLIMANTAMQNSTNPEAIEVVEMAKKEIAKTKL